MASTAMSVGGSVGYCGELLLMRCIGTICCLQATVLHAKGVNPVRASLMPSLIISIYSLILYFRM